MTRLALLSCLALSCHQDSPSATPLVTVEKLDLVQSCFATCPGSLDPAPELHLADHCASPAGACGFLGGADKLRVIVDYGEVPIPASSAVSAPSITLVLDGLEQPAPPVASPPPLDDRRYFADIFYAPEKTVTLFGIRAKAAEGFSQELDLFSIQTPDFQVSADGCSDIDNCARTADVGAATFTIDVPGGFSDTSAILTSALNGVLQAETQQVKLTGKGTQFEGRGTLSVPPSNMAGSNMRDFWDVTVAVGSFSKIVHFVLSPPDITVGLSGCNGTACSAPLATPATVTVTAPHDINVTQAVVTWDVDGAPTGQLLTQPWNLSDVSTRSAQLSLTVPAQGTRWTIHALVGEYPGQLDVTLTAPAVTVAVAGCADVNSCSLVADVGTAVFTIDVPRPSTQTSATLSSLLNGVPQAEVEQVPLVATGNAQEGVGKLTVPPPNSAQSGSLNFWEVDVRVGAEVQKLHLTLTQQLPTLTIPACPGGPCSLTQGTSTTVLVGAPHDINETVAGLVSFADGVPSGTPLTQPWTLSDVATRTAVFTLNAPSSGHSWILQANVGSLIVQSQTITLSP